MKSIIMLGTSPATQGGIASVVRVYRDAGLFERYGIRYLSTHCDGGKWHKAGAMARAWLRFALLLVTGQAGVVHAHVASRASFWRKAAFLLPAFLFRVPVILHLHGAEFVQFFENECGPVRQRFVRWVFNQSAHVIVLSETWKNWVASTLRSPHVVAIYNPVIVPERSADWHGRTPGAVLSLGRIGKRKGSFDLVDALARGDASLPGSLQLRLGGDGALDELRGYAEQRHVSAEVHLLGWVSGAERQHQLDSAWLYALPSYNEGLPMSVLEAMAAGLPVVATPVGGIPEAVSDGVEGFLIAPGDIDALAERLQRLAADNQLARRMGAAARSKIEATFSATAVLPRVEKLYQDLGFTPR